MSCGQIALNELGIIPEMYLAAEIKPHAIKVTQTNFPNTIQLGDQDKGIELQSILESGFTNRKKSVCIVRNYAGSVQSSNVESFKRMCNQRAKKGFLTVVYEEKDNPESVRLFTRTELEKLQTVPLGYTNCVDYMAAADLLGDGWTVEVIKHIFKGLK